MSVTDDVLRALGEHALDASHKMLDHVAQRETLAATGLRYEEWHRGLVELRERKLVQMRDYDGRVALLALTQAGVWAYATRFRADLADVTERLLDLLESAEANVALPLAEELCESPLLVEAILEHLAGRRMVVYSRVGRDSFRIHRFGG